jgi:hypothetical protein
MYTLHEKGFCRFGVRIWKKDFEKEFNVQLQRCEKLESRYI